MPQVRTQHVSFFCLFCSFLNEHTDQTTCILQQLKMQNYIHVDVGGYNASQYTAWTLAKNPQNVLHDGKRCYFFNEEPIFNVTDWRLCLEYKYTVITLPIRQATFPKIAEYVF